MFHNVGVPPLLPFIHQLQKLSLIAMSYTELICLFSHYSITKITATTSHIISFLIPKHAVFTSVMLYCVNGPVRILFMVPDRAGRPSHNTRNTNTQKEQEQQGQA
jgi:hypothetical protein